MHGAGVLKGTIMVDYGLIRYCLGRTLTRNQRLLHPAMRFQYLWQAVQEAGHGGGGPVAPRSLLPGLQEVLQYSSRQILR